MKSLSLIAIFLVFGLTFAFAQEKGKTAITEVPPEEEEELKLEEQLDQKEIDREGPSEYKNLLPQLRDLQKATEEAPESSVLDPEKKEEAPARANGDDPVPTGPVWIDR